MSRRGRPAIGGAEGSERLDVRVPQSLYDALVAEAAALGVPLADHVRSVLDARELEQPARPRARRLREAAAELERQSEAIGEQARALRELASGRA